MFKFASKEDGQAIISMRDDLFIRMSPVERALKIGYIGVAEEDEYIEHLKRCVLPWNPDEIAKINEALSSIQNIIGSLGMNIAEEVYIIKTSGKDEWNSAYTRSNAIFLPLKKIQSYNVERLIRLILHEFFHVFFRVRMDLQEHFYSAVGFNMIDEVSLPVQLINRKLTNPDAPFLNSYIEVEHENNKVYAVPVNLLKEGYGNVDSNEDILESIEVKMLSIENINDKWEIECVSNIPIVYDLSEVKGFYEKTGNNTPEMIEPDEILAENFVYYALCERNVPSLNILDCIGEVLKKYL